MKFLFITKETLALKDLIRGLGNFKNEISFICCETSIKIIEYIDEYFFFIIVNDNELLHKHYECDKKIKFKINTNTFLNKFERGCNIIEIKTVNNKIQILFYKNNELYVSYSNIKIEEYTNFQKEPIKFNRIFSLDTFNFIAILNQLNSKIKNKNELLYINLYSEHVDFASDYDKITLYDNMVKNETEYLEVKLNFKKIYNLVKYNKKLSLFVKIYINPNCIVLKYNGIFKITNMIIC